jgi:hypothetical protein
VTLDQDRIATELILKPSIAALGNGTLVVANGFSRGKFDLLAATGVWSIKGTWPKLRHWSRSSVLQ